MALCMATADVVEDALAESGITNYYGNLYVSGEYAFYRFNSSELAAADASFQAGELQSVTIDGLVISDWRDILPLVCRRGSRCIGARRRRHTALV